MPLDRLFTLIAISWLFFSCNSSSSNLSENYKPEKVSCIFVSNTKICIPSEWSVVKQQKFFFFTRINKDDENAYFVILKKKIADGFTPEEYLKMSYQALKGDTVESAMGYTVKKVLMEDKTLYRCEYFTKIKGIEYISYSLLFTYGGNFYDITFKTKLKDSPRSQLDYNYAIFNFEINDEKYFKEWYLVNTEEIIDISKL